MSAYGPDDEADGDQRGEDAEDLGNIDGYVGPELLALRCHDGFAVERSARGVDDDDISNRDADSSALMGAVFLGITRGSTW